MNRPLISLCMIVKDEAESLAQCLNSVRGVAGELIIVDTGSTDHTVQIARSNGARIISFPWKGDFAAARNAGLQQAKGIWILVLDADEELDAGSREELLLCAEHTEYEAFFLRIHNHKGTSRTSPVITVNPILRMFRNRPEYRFSGIIHEQIAAVIVEANPAAAMHLSTVTIHHYGYADGVVAKKDKIRRNVELLKEQLKLNPRDAFHHFNMAVEYMRLGEFDPALSHIKRSLEEVEPDTSYIHLLYKYEIRCRAAKKDIAGALETCTRGTALFPDYPDLHHLKGVLLLQAGAFPEAKAALHCALRIGASPPGYHTESGLGTYLTLTALGQLCQETGEDNEAIVCYTKAAQLHPEPGPLVSRLLRIFKCSGRELEFAGWLEAHLPAVQAALPVSLPALLLKDGCFAAAGAAMAAGDTVAAGAAAAGAAAGTAMAVGDTVVAGAAMGTDEAMAAGDTMAAGTAASPGDNLLEQLHRLSLAPAEQLSREDIAGMLSHPALYGPARTGLVAPPSVQHGLSWILLADRVLDSLPASAGYSPAARRARLLLPLPRTSD